MNIKQQFQFMCFQIILKFLIAQERSIMLIITALLENFIILTFQPGTPGWHKQNDRMSRI